ncbi:MAG: NAD(P)H-dependent oxidoreductase [Ilumatobacter sp.]|nr:NAD(P)H-dependent oxidoreductase [Ilumatobacter sp.]
MHAAVVIAHPCDDSFTKELAAGVVAGLRAGHHTVDVVDLYALGFAPAMTTAERAAYHGDEPILDPLVAVQASLVQRVDTLVFVYPTWWSGLPAILKGWLDRVLVPGVGFVFDERTTAVRPGLTNVRRIIGVSTYGSPRRYVRFVNDNGRRTLTRALRASCGLRTRVRWYACYGIDTSTAADRAEFAASVERAMAGLR